MPTKAQRNAGWTPGVSRRAAIYVLPEFRAAVDRVAASLNITNGVVVERALLEFFRSLPSTLANRALGKVATVSCHAEARGYTPRGGGKRWAALVTQWGPAPFPPRKGFRWEEGPAAARPASKGTAHHCLWCDAYTVTGAEVLEHKPDCPTLDG